MTLPTNPLLAIFDEQDEQNFYLVIEKLKERQCLPSVCFQKELPYFNLPALTKEFQMREIFEGACNPQACKQLLRNIVFLQQAEEYKFVPQNLSPVSAMSFAQIVLYKVLPCPDEPCRDAPREIATHNQYKDYEYSCPFYHHERDRRRPCIAVGSENEFSYKANYYEEGKRQGNKQKYARNYFESMYHPLYYKMFQCKRSYCEKSAFCPFNHSLEERNLWDASFKSYIGLDRHVYVKNKQMKHKTTIITNKIQAKQSEEVTLAAIRELQGFFDGYGGKPSVIQTHFALPPLNTSLAKSMNGQFGQVVADERSSPDSSFEEQYGYGFMSKLRAANHYQLY